MKTKRQIPLPRYFVTFPMLPEINKWFYIERDFVSNNRRYTGCLAMINIPEPLDHTKETL